MRSATGCVSICALIAGSFQLAGCGQKQSEETEEHQLISELASVIPARMNVAGIPGLSIALVRSGRVIWAEGFGVTDTSDPAPVRADTVFETASLSKPVFALAYLKLAHQSDLDLDEPLASSFTYERLSHDERYKQITPQLILSHLTGLPNWDREGALEFDRDPGARFGYSGEGYVYLQKYVEYFTQQSLHDFVKDMIFTPANMRLSGFVWQDRFARSFAEGHDKDGAVQPSDRYKEGNAAYSLMSTSLDYGRFLGEFMQGIKRGGEVNTAMVMPQVSMTGSETRTRHADEIWSTISWGLGWGIQDLGNEKIYWHWGDNDDYRCFAAFSIDRDIGFVYLTNSQNGLSIANELATMIVGDMHWTIMWLGYEGLSSER